MAPSPDTTFLLATEMFADLCDHVAETDWTTPGLGEWDVRALVGHTLRAVTTVRIYLGQPSPAAATCTSAGDYFARARRMPGADSRSVADRGHQAGLDLGSRPVEAVRTEVVKTRAALGATVDAGGMNTIVNTVVGAMRLGDYLPTRTFELAAHSLDIAAACGLDFQPPFVVIESAVQTAAHAMTLTGDSAAVLRHLIGRPTEGFRPLFA